MKGMKKKEWYEWQHAHLHHCPSQESRGRQEETEREEKRASDSVDSYCHLLADSSIHEAQSGVLQFTWWRAHDGEQSGGWQVVFTSKNDSHSAVTIRWSADRVFMHITLFSFNCFFIHLFNPDCLSVVTLGCIKHKILRTDGAKTCRRLQMKQLETCQHQNGQTSWSCIAPVNQPGRSWRS